VAHSTDQRCNLQFSEGTRLAVVSFRVSLQTETKRNGDSGNGNETLSFAWKLERNETETKRKRYFLARNSKTVVLSILYVRLYSLFRSKSHISPEETFIWVFAEPLNFVSQTHFSN
jgi:hypothetical protein